MSASDRYPCGCLIIAVEHATTQLRRHEAEWVYDRRIGWHDPASVRAHWYTVPVVGAA